MPVWLHRRICLFRKASNENKVQNLPQSARFNSFLIFRFGEPKAARRLIEKLCKFRIVEGRQESAFVTLRRFYQISYLSCCSRITAWH